MNQLSIAFAVSWSLFFLTWSSNGFSTSAVYLKSAVSNHLNQRHTAVRRFLAVSSNDEEELRPVDLKSAVLSLALGGILLTSPIYANAYEPNDYASETVRAAVQSIRDANGNVEQTLKAYENVAEIITEGKGVGGSINYKGVQLDRGYIADEDTSIYNPGLSLLTESEKERLVEAVVDAKKVAVEKGQWNTDNQIGYDFLREKLDPLHMYELKGYLNIVPMFIGVVYLAVLAVQQLARSLFPAAYIAGVAIIVVPALVLVAVGP